MCCCWVLMCVWFGAFACVRRVFWFFFSFCCAQSWRNSVAASGNRFGHVCPQVARARGAHTTVDAVGGRWARAENAACTCTSCALHSRSRFIKRKLVWRWIVRVVRSKLYEMTQYTHAKSLPIEETMIHNYRLTRRLLSCFLDFLI